jgi:translation initiation factor IF-3
VNLDHLVNDQIKTKDIRLVGDTGEQIGVIATREALYRARQAGLDLVVISDKVVPPVCRITNYSKFKYELVKKEKEIAKKAKATQTELKEIQMRPVTDSHDIAIKVKNAQRFLAEGNKVKIVVKFKGREVNHAEMGYKVLTEFLATLGEHKIERAPSLTGKDMIAIISAVKVVQPS